VRSRAAAAILAGAGFRKVASMEGGISAWDGLVAAGPPEAGMARFAAAASAEELIALAWYLEAGSRTFYGRIAGTAGDPESAALYEQLGRAEEGHLDALQTLYRRNAGPKAAVGPGTPKVHQSALRKCTTLRHDFSRRQEASGGEGACSGWTRYTSYDTRCW
jgi:hypothetical protein